jgi:peptide/nickel transport system substrate-binding protein
MRTTQRLAVAAAAVTLSAAMAACGSSNAKISNGAAVHGTPLRGGTVLVAEPPGASPNLIFPLLPSTNSNGYNENLTIGLWPYLVYIGDGSQSTVNPQESLYSSLTWSHNDSVVTIVLKPWKWSDGVPITSRDFTFVYNLLKANYNNWLGYIPGLFPVDVKQVLTPNSHTVVIDLTRSYNPTFYTDDVLSEIPLLPQHAWDRTSQNGPVGNYDETTKGAVAVYNFLQKVGDNLATFDTNPLWQVVDGPWKLAKFNSSGYYAWVPNKNYSGPDKARLSEVEWTPFTDDTAEMDTLRSGTTLDLAYVPANDLKQLPELQAEGYRVFQVPTPGVAQILPNFWPAGASTPAGPLVRQLYIREALEYLIDRPLLVSKVYDGYADPGNGPVPVDYGQSWDTAQERAGGPYPYSPAKADALLKAHGWKVVQNGISTCTRPGTGPTDCGAGITSGQPLQFQLLYATGTASFDQQNAAIQSSEDAGGIHITLKGEPFNTLVATTGTCNQQSHTVSACSWQLQQFGYIPYSSLDPSGAGSFNTDAIGNYGGYSSTEMNNLIDATEYGSSPAAFAAYENYAAAQLPWLWLPLQAGVYVYKSNLAGVTPVNPFSVGLNPELWYYVKPHK